MKQVFPLFILSIVALCAALTGCDERFETPERNHTLLWPAYCPETKGWGFINAKGEFEIQPVYSGIVHGFSCGYALVEMTKNNFEQTKSMFFIDKKGNIKQGLYDYADDFYYNISTIGLNGKYGFMNTSFKFTCEPTFDALGRIGKNGLAPAQKEDIGTKFTYVDKYGHTKINALYDKAYDFDGDVAIVAIGFLHGTIDKKGNFILPPRYDYLTSCGNGITLGMRWLEAAWKIYAPDGKQLMHLTITDAGTCFDNDLLPIQVDDKWMYISTIDGSPKLGYIQSGDSVSDGIFDMASCFYDGHAVVRRDGYSEVIDTQGNTVMTLLEEDSFSTLFLNGLALVYTYPQNSTDCPSYRYVDINNNVVYSWTENCGRNNVIAHKPSADKSDLLEMTLHFDSRKLHY